MSEVRRRTLLLKSLPTHGVLDTWSQGKKTNISSNLTAKSVTGTQETVSSGNAFHKLLRKREGLDSKRQWDIGSPFRTSRHEYEASLPQHVSAWTAEHSPSSYQNYQGPIWLKPRLGSASDFPTHLETSEKSLRDHGATAISRVLPTNPAADLTTFAAELVREGLPSIVGAQLLSRRNGPPPSRVGSEYLNWEFGWAPIISGLKDFANVAQDWETILEQYRRDSGKNVRRRYTFPDAIETTTRNEGTLVTPRPLSASFFNRTGTTTITTKKTRSVWFSGCFTYYLDPGDTALGKANRHAQEARKLLNIELTPEVVWNLSPWSWAVDWISNAGDVFHNMSAFQQDGLVMRWGYLMETTVSEETWTMTGLNWKRGAGPSSLSETFRTITKRRIHASPYGFDFDWEGLTARQGGIIAALGLTMGRSGRRPSP